MERVRRVELPTLCLASIRSSQLSYTRVEFLLQQGCRFVNYSRLQRAPNARISNGKTAGGSWRQTTLRQPPKRRENTFPERKNRSPSTDSEEHTSELQSRVDISYAVFCLKKKKQ